jgi:hypothetical protein
MVDRKHANTRKMLQYVHVRSNATEVRSFATAHCGLSEARVRTQQRTRRAQVRGRPGIGPRAFERMNCVQPHSRRLIFQKLNRNKKQEQKNDNPNFFNLNFYIFLDFIYTKARNK